MMLRRTVLLLPLLLIVALFIESINHDAVAQDGGQLIYGQTVIGTISATEPIAIHVFEGSVGDQVRVEVTALTAGIGPHVQLVDGSGGLVESVDNEAVSFASLDATLPQDGSYMLIVSATSGVGDYILSLEAIATAAPTSPPTDVPATATATPTPDDNTAPQDSGTLAYGQSVMGTISATEPIAIHVFEGGAGDQVHVEVIALTPDLGPHVELIGAAGALADSAGNETASFAGLDATLPQAGSYTLLVSTAGVSLGDYILLLSVEGTGEAVATPQPTDAAPATATASATTTPVSPDDSVNQDGGTVTHSQSVLGSISATEPIAFHGFEGNAGDQVHVEVIALTPDLGPHVELLGNSGVLADSAGNETASLAGLEATLPQAGSYTLLVSTVGGDLGDYVLLLSVEGTSEAVATPQPTDAAPATATPSMTVTPPPPAIRTAPRDTNPITFSVPRGGASFSEAISFPDGDTRDDIMLVVEDLVPGTPQTFRISLTCEGINAEAVRWSVAGLNGPADGLFTCGDNFQKPYLATETGSTSEISVFLTAPQADAPSYVTYTLTAEPASPEPDDSSSESSDGGVLDFMLSLEEPRELSNQLSSAGGQVEQGVRFRVPHMPSGQTHEFEVVLKCDSDVETAELAYLRLDADFYPCDEEVILPVTRDPSGGEAGAEGAVTLLEAGSLSYTLTAKRIGGPAAPEDQDSHLFMLHSDTPAAFSNAVSAPSGDVTDAVYATLPGTEQEASFNLNVMCTVNTGPLAVLVAGTTYNCGDSFTLTLTGSAAPLQIFMAEPGYAAYTLEAEPLSIPAETTPPDTSAVEDTFYLSFTPAGGQFAGFVPADGLDRLNITIEELVQPRTDLRFTLVCAEGTIQAEDAGPYDCGTSFVLPWSGQAGQITSDARTFHVRANDTGYLLVIEPLTTPDQPAPIGEIAPPDGDHRVELALAGPTHFEEAISAPQGDTVDTVTLLAPGLPVGESRLFDVTLSCAGSGGEAVRWTFDDGSAAALPACGATHTIQLERTDLEFEAGVALAIELSQGEGFITYVIEAEPQGDPTAPLDPGVHLFALAAEPSTFFEELSYPQGDPYDTILAHLPGLPSRASASFDLTLTCSDAQNLRWLVDGVEHGCDATVRLTLDGGPRELAVYTTGEVAGYFTYKLAAIPVTVPPISPPTSDVGEPTHYFTFPAAGGNFAEVAAYGTVETLVIDLEGLASGEHAYTLTLLCSDPNGSMLRWEAEALTSAGGLIAGKRCGDAVTLGFQAEDAQAPSAYRVGLNLLAPPAVPGDSIPYTLLVAPQGSTAGGQAIEEAVALQFDLSTAGPVSFAQAVSQPGDGLDTITARAPGLAVGEPRSFTFTVHCAGLHAERLIWSLDAPTDKPFYICGDSVTVILERTNAEFVAGVGIGVSVEQAPANITYIVEAAPEGEPVAPLDADAHLFLLDPAVSQSTFAEAISAPEGDREDTVFVQLPGIVPGGEAEFTFTLRCDSTATVSWDVAGESHLCGEAVNLVLGDGLTEMSLTLADKGYQSYVIEAEPLALVGTTAPDAAEAVADDVVANFPAEGGSYAGSVPYGGEDGVRVRINGPTPDEGSVFLTVLCSGPHADALRFSATTLTTSGGPPPDIGFSCGTTVDVPFVRAGQGNFDPAVLAINYVAEQAPTAPSDDALIYVLVLEPGFGAEEESDVPPASLTPVPMATTLPTATATATPTPTLTVTPTPTSVPFAPSDARQHQLILKTRSGVLREQVSFPSGDGEDIVRVSVSVPGEYVFGVACSGPGQDGVRWSQASNTRSSLACGDSLRLPVTDTVQLRIVADQSTVSRFVFVTYDLRAQFVSSLATATFTPVPPSATPFRVSPTPGKVTVTPSPVPSATIVPAKASPTRPARVTATPLPARVTATFTPSKK